MLIDTNLSDYQLGFDQSGDVALVLKFIKELAEYEKRREPFYFVFS